MPRGLLVMVTAVAAVAPALAGTARAADAPSTVVTLRSCSPVEQATKAMVAAVEKTHPGIEVRATIQPHAPYFTALSAAAASGTLPDFIGQPLRAFTQECRLHQTDLGPAAQALRAAGWKKNFPPTLLHQAQLGDPKGDAGFYVPPQEAEALNIWYNRAAFERAKIARPPTTIGELVADAKALRGVGPRHA